MCRGPTMIRRIAFALLLSLVASRAATSPPNIVILLADDPGYGFVTPEVPELGMAVVEGHRRRGLGRLVLSRLLERHPAMSLSVDLQNDVARRLYESLGFQPVAEEGTALTMIRLP